MNEVIAKQIGEATKRGFLRKVGAKVRECHWGWLVVGILVGWPIDWLFLLLQSSLHFIAPIIAPMIVDAVLGPINEMIVAALPLICFGEILRRMGVAGDEDEKKDT